MFLLCRTAQYRLTQIMSLARGWKYPQLLNMLVMWKRMHEPISTCAILCSSLLNGNVWIFGAKSGSEGWRRSLVNRRLFSNNLRANISCIVVDGEIVVLILPSLT